MLVQLSIASRMKLLRPSAAEVRNLVDNWFRTLADRKVYKVGGFGVFLQANSFSLRLVAFFLSADKACAVGT